MESAEIAGDRSIFGSVPLFRVFLCARCRPQMNTLKFHTQTGVPLVPCASALLDAHTISVKKY
ncbi:MAG: hypothetical protein ABSC77_04835 [Terracidiphilus sp.]|jgi:hypothetical protein